jgi:hypothetical protein
MKPRLLAEIRNNHRLRWGILLIFGTLWLYGLLLMRDTLQAQKLRHNTLTQSITRLQGQLTQPEWLDRLEAANVTATQFDGRLWRAPTAGLAQAAFQEWIEAKSKQAGISRPQIAIGMVAETAAGDADQKNAANTTTPEGAPPADLWKVTAKLSFEATPLALLNYLSLIEGNDRQVMVATLNARTEPTPRVDMELHSYFQKQKGIEPLNEKAPASKKTPLP